MRCFVYLVIVKIKTFVMPTLYPYRLFLSHAWNYHESYLKLIDFLNKANNFIIEIIVSQKTTLLEKCQTINYKKH